MEKISTRNYMFQEITDEDGRIIKIKRYNEMTTMF